MVLQKASGVGIEENSLISSISPNPAHGKVYIALENRSDKLLIRQVGLDGRIIHQVVRSDLDKFEFDIFGAPGYYFLEFIGNDHNWVRYRILKQ